MASHRLDLTYRAGWFGLGERLGRTLPRSALRALGASWGRIFAWTHPEKVAVVRKNLALLGEGHGHEAVRVYAEFGKVLADYFYAARSVETAVGLVDERH